MKRHVTVAFHSRLLLHLSLDPACKVSTSLHTLWERLHHLPRETPPPLNLLRKTLPPLNLSRKTPPLQIRRERLHPLWMCWERLHPLWIRWERLHPLWIRWERLHPSKSGKKDSIPSECVEKDSTPSESGENNSIPSESGEKDSTPSESVKIDSTPSKLAEKIPQPPRSLYISKSIPKKDPHSHSRVYWYSTCYREWIRFSFSPDNSPDPNQFYADRTVKQFGNWGVHVKITEIHATYENQTPDSSQKERIFSGSFRLVNLLKIIIYIMHMTSYTISYFICTFIFLLSSQGAESLLRQLMSTPQHHKPHPLPPICTQSLQLIITQQLQLQPTNQPLQSGNYM